MPASIRTRLGVVLATLAVGTASLAALTAGPAVADTSCSGLSAWTASAVFTGGQRATHSDHGWTAKWWTQGDEPGHNSQDVWTDDGTCGDGGGGSTTPPPTTSPTSPTSPPTSPPASGLHYFSAPYVMPGESLPDLADVMSTTGQRTFMLAFILAPSGGGCSPTWDGTRPIDTDTLAQPVIDTVRSRGGDVSVSIGGYGGTKLGQACSSVAATAAAYQQVITRYSLKAIDLDLEEPEYEDLTAVDHEIGAAATLLHDNPGLQLSFTVPGTVDGTGYFGQNVLNVAKSYGLTGANFTIMPFDGGFNGASSQIDALEKFHTKLMNTFGVDSSTAYAHEGVSMMNGVTDAGEHFYPTDFQAVLDYATAHGLGRYTFWSVGRDRPCADGATTAKSYCSGIAQSNWQFTTYTAQFPH